MSRTLNQFIYPLDWVFTAPSHIAILRALQDSKEGMSARAIARNAHINHQTCNNAVLNLERIGILNRMGSGKTQLISFNLKNSFVNSVLLPLLKGERNVLQTLKTEIIENFKDTSETITLFGSAARKETYVGSDLDVLFVPKSNLKRSLDEKLRAFGLQFFQNYGIRFSPITFSIEEAKGRLKKSDPLLRNILKDGIDLLPQTLHEVLQWPHDK